MSVNWNPPSPNSTALSLDNCLSPSTHHHTLQDNDNLEEPGAADHSDRIGDTVFSKSWVLSLLVQAVDALQDQHFKDTQCCSHETNKGAYLPGNVRIEDVERLSNDAQDTCTHKCASHKRELRNHPQTIEMEKTNARGDIEGSDGVVVSERRIIENVATDGDSELQSTPGNVHENGDMDPTLDSDLCRLWDASMNKDVASFICAQNGVQLLMGIAKRSTLPRLTEITIGILGNITCDLDLCLKNFGSEVVQEVLGFMNSSDPGTLIETTRLIQTCLLHEASNQMWCSEIESSLAIRHSILFILCCSRNDDLLKCTSNLLDVMFDSSEKLMQKWADSELVEAICEAMEQTMISTNFKAISSLVMILHSLTTFQEGVHCIDECKVQVLSVLNHFLTSVDRAETPKEPVTAAQSILQIVQDVSSDCRNV